MLKQASRDESELLQRAIANGRELVRIVDAIDQPLAGIYIGTGIDILKAHADLYAELALSTLQDTSEVPARLAQ